MPHKILYIEDNILNINLIRRMLTLTDYELLIAYDGLTGFEMALKEMPELILLDMNLPDISGIDVIRYLKESSTLQQTPIVALTADTSSATFDQCISKGCVGVLHKPISRFTLLDTLRRFTSMAFLETTAREYRMQNEETAPAKKVLKVLIAEDNPDLRVIFARTFDRRHFSVSVAVDGVEAIESLQAELPDVLILDINMPRISGFEVLRYIRQNQNTKDMKVVVVTGNCMAMQTPEAEYADLFLIKPVNIADLVTLAQRLIPAAV